MEGKIVNCKKTGKSFVKSVKEIPIIRKTENVINALRVVLKRNVPFWMKLICKKFN